MSLPFRRGVLRAALPASVLAAAAGLPWLQASALGMCRTLPSDAELIQACAEAMHLGEELDRLGAVWAAADNAGDKATEEAAFEAQLALMPAFHAALDRVWALPAHTAEGRRARALLALRRVQRHDDERPCSREDCMTAALCDDVLNLTGRTS